MFAIEVENLNKHYKNGIKASNNLNFTVRKGEIFSLLGPNGAGKSTLINMLTTFYKPTSGKAKIFGKDIVSNPNWVRKQIACVSQKISIDEHLSLTENMIFQSKLYKVDSNISKDRIKTLIDIFDLSTYLAYPVASYSGGVKRRLDIAMNLVSFPKVLFLDEPTVGMDVESRGAMWDMLLKIRNELGTTIFLTTHYLEEADFLSDTICIMKNGSILAKGTKNQLSNYIQQNIIRITYPNNEVASKYKNILKTNFSNELITQKDKYILISLKDASNLSFFDINTWILENTVNFTGIEIIEPTLEDIFISITNSDDNKREGIVC